MNDVITVLQNIVTVEVCKYHLKNQNFSLRSGIFGKYLGIQFDYDGVRSALEHIMNLLDMWHHSNVCCFQI